MTRPRPLTRIASIVEADAQLKAWNDRRIREDALLRAVRRVLPRPVAERVFVTNGGAAQLELGTTAGAIASVVRQRGPDIVAALAREGWQFSGIRIRVQPQSMPLAYPKPEARQWDSSARRPMAALHDRLAGGPLKDALGRLLRRG